MKTFLKAKTLLLIISVFVVSTYQLTGYSADIYKTVDENGKVTYSDKMTSDKSEKVETKQLNTLPATQPTVPVRKTTRKTSVPNNYDIRIVQPSNNFHVNPGQRDLTIQVTTVPHIYTNHRLQISDNGAPIQGTVIKEITRGSHVIVAMVIDERGRVISESEPVSVFVHRPGKR